MKVIYVVTCGILAILLKRCSKNWIYKIYRQVRCYCIKKDNKIAVVMLNRTEEKIPAYLRLNGYCAEMEVEPNAIATAVIEE